MTRRDEVDRLIEVITVGCYNLAEQVTAFYEAFAEAVPLPTAVVGATMRVLGIDIAEHGEDLTARSQRGDVQDLRLSDLVFPPDTAAAWIHAACRRCLGLTAHPAAAPAGWKPSGCEVTRARSAAQSSASAVPGHPRRRLCCVDGSLPRQRGWLDEALSPSVAACVDAVGVRWVPFPA